MNDYNITTNNMSTAQNVAIAQEIVNQLGGGRFKAMTGVKNIIALNTADYPYGGVRMDLRANNTRANRLEITLNGLDQYDVRFYYSGFDRKKLRGILKEVAKYEGVECENLQQIFTDVTGMRTRLF